MYEIKPANQLSNSFRITLFRFLIAVIFSIAFAYIESAVVVYLREIFYPDGFTFPLEILDISSLSKRLLYTEIGREAATLVLILTGAWLFGYNKSQRIAYFLTIFAVWDIFYYVWLKVLLDWPASIMEWDILFLIPVTWASPVLAPVLCSVVMLLFAIAILYFDCIGKTIRTKYLDWSLYCISVLIIIVSFCIPGPHTNQADYSRFFYWSLFSTGLILSIVVFIKSILKSIENPSE